MERLGSVCLVLCLLVGCGFAVMLPVGAHIGCDGIEMPQSTTQVPLSAVKKAPTIPEAAPVAASGPETVVIVETTNLFLVPNQWSVVYCPTVVVESLTVDDGFIRQVVGPLQVNTNVQVSASALLLQAEVSVANDVILQQALVVAQNKTSVSGRMSVLEESTASFLSRAQIASLLVSSNSFLEISNANETHLPEESIITLNSCDLTIDGEIIIILSEYQLEIIQGTLTSSESVSIPLIDANCANNLTIPAKIPRLMSKGQNVTTYLLSVSSSQSSSGSTSSLRAVFELDRADPTGENALGGGSPEASNRSKIIIGSSVGGAALLVAVLLLVVYNIPAVNKKIFPHRSRAGGRITTI